MPTYLPRNLALLLAVGGGLYFTAAPAPLIDTAKAQTFSGSAPAPPPPTSGREPVGAVTVVPVTTSQLEYATRLGRPPKMNCDYSAAMGVPAASGSARSTAARAGFNAFETGDYEKSVKLVAAAARRGDLPAGYALACIMDALDQASFAGRSGPLETADPAVAGIYRAKLAARAVRPELYSALAWMRWVAEAGFEPAQVEIARHADGPSKMRWEQAAFDWVARLAEKGRPAEIRQLAFLYIEGRGKPLDREEGIRLMRKAAEAGDREAMLSLVGLLRAGAEAESGDREAEIIKWLRRLAAAGDNGARFYLALAMREGGARAGALGEAVDNLGRAVADGDSAAAYELAIWYRQGIGVGRDLERAQALVRQAAQGGYCRALIEEAERQVAANADELTADGKKQLEDVVARCNPGWLRSQEEDFGSGFALSRAERAGWDARRQAVRQALGSFYFDEANLKRALLSGDRQKEDQAIHALVTMASGDRDTFSDSAIATLAYPAEWIPSSVRARFDSEIWRRHIESLAPEMRDRVHSAILSTGLSNQNFAAALQTSLQTGSEEALLRRFDTLVEMGLQAVAFRELLSYLPSAKSDAIRDKLVSSTIACEWDKVASDWVARAGWDEDGCGAVHALRRLDSKQLEQLTRLGSNSATIFLALDKLEGRTGPLDFAGARALLESADPKYEEGQIAQGILGSFAEEGIGGAPDLVSAAFHYQRGLSDFDRNADEVWIPASPAIATRLGRMLLEGRGIGRDLPRALELVRFGAYMAVASADTALGDSLWLGLGQARDRQEALRWYRRATDLGDPVALVRFGLLARLGLWNERGLGAGHWLDLAARADDREAYLELARAAALAPMSDDPDLEVRSWLEHAATRGSGWARLWLAACDREKGVACFRRQPGFERLSSSIALTAAPGAASRSGFGLDSRAAAARLQADVASLARRADNMITYGNDFINRTEALDDLERVQLQHGDVDGAIGTALRRLVVEDAHLASDHGSIRNYFSLIESSCHWGEASRVAYGNDRRDAALFMAKVAVNRLQQARGYLADLDGDLKECFVKAHEDRYRWLAGLLIENGRLAEAETVLNMLKDFEHAQYTGDRARRRASAAGIVYSPAEALALAALDRAADAMARAMTAEEAEGGAVAPGLSFRNELDALIREVARLDAGRPAQGLASRADWLASIQRSIVVDLGRLFDPDTVALHAVVLPDRISWIISTAQGQSSLTIKVGHAELNAAITDYLAAIHTRSPDIEAKALKLYRLVFEPVDEKLRLLHASNLLLSLDDRLRYLPFAALFDGRGWLVERYGFSSFRRPSDYMRAGPGGPWTVAGFGATRGGNGLNELPGVARELDEIVRTGDADSKGVVPGVVELDDSFTRSTFAAALKSDYRVIHIASHFVLSEVSAGDSYLLLGNGEKLPLPDFSADGAFTFSHVDLVTLSACQTALHSAAGNGSEIDSMGTVAQDAGAPAVVASLWSVNDDSTASLMQGFYRHRVTEGLTTAAALRRAQLELIQEARRAAPAGSVETGTEFGHPYYWAPFIILGNGR